MGGLGLDAFLGHGEGGGRRKFLGKWKDDGSIVVWLSTRADIAYASWSHPFMYRDTFTKKEDGQEEGEEVEILRFTRFVSPDPEPIHLSQYFRHDDGVMKLPPRLDPFLRLREWLRHECQEPDDAIVFEWENPKNGERIQWRKGHLAGTVKRGKATFGASLDTKLEYLFVVIDAEKPGEGPQITRETRSLGDAMKAVIKAEIESNGDEGNPILHPYAFKWKFNKDADPAKMYSAARFNQAKLTAAVREAITTDEFPDPSQDTKPRPGDKAKIRAAMEEAAQIDLPWDHIFVPQWKDEDPTDFNFGANAKGDAEEKPAERRRTPEVETKKADTSSSAGGRVRRKKKDEPPPPPKEETIPCDDCGFEMAASATKCPKCGAEYEVEEQPDAAPSKAAAAPPKTKPSGDADRGKCWSCGSTNIQGGNCVDCGLDITDDIPFG